MKGNTLRNREKIHMKNGKTRREIHVSIGIIKSFEGQVSRRISNYHVYDLTQRMRTLVNAAAILVRVVYISRGFRRKNSARFSSISSRQNSCGIFSRFTNINSTNEYHLVSISFLVTFSKFKRQPLSLYYGNTFSFSTFVRQPLSLYYGNHFCIFLKSLVYFPLSILWSHLLNSLVTSNSLLF
jgi:hypothetical protein